MAVHRSRPEWFLAVIVTLSMCNAAAASVFQPVSDSHRSAAVEMFTASVRSLSLEETYEALRIFEVLGIDKKDFLRLVEKFYYLSGRYELKLAVGYSVMENSFLWPIGHIELDMPEASEVPEKRPPKELSLAFLGLSLLPFFGFLVGNFPSSPMPATFAFLFHIGIGAILSLYLLFWLKLDLFTTLKVLGLYGAFLLFVRHRILSHLAAVSAKLKSA